MAGILSNNTNVSIRFHSKGDLGVRSKVLLKEHLDTLNDNRDISVSSPAAETISATIVNLKGVVTRSKVNVFDNFCPPTSDRAG